jgi:hypothetical protein
MSGSYIRLISSHLLYSSCRFKVLRPLSSKSIFSKLICCLWSKLRLHMTYWNHRSLLMPNFSLQCCCCIRISSSFFKDIWGLVILISIPMTLKYSDYIFGFATGVWSWSWTQSPFRRNKTILLLWKFSIDFIIVLYPQLGLLFIRISFYFTVNKQKLLKKLNYCYGCHYWRLMPQLQSHSEEFTDL